MCSCPCPYLPASLFVRPSSRQPFWILDLLFGCDLICGEPQEPVWLLDLLSCRAESCLLAVGGPPTISLAHWPPLHHVHLLDSPLHLHSDKGICQADEQSELKRCVMHAWKDLTSCRGWEDAGFRYGDEHEDRKQDFGRGLSSPQLLFTSGGEPFAAADGFRSATRILKQ